MDKHLQDKQRNLQSKKVDERKANEQELHHSYSC
jgi:hypothetical protein